jgi:glycosyltransferase involved in cell wall biosynthesis
MIVRNEAQLIGNCLASIEAVCDEIIVVDTGSKDATPEIAARAGARVIRYVWDGNYGAARNRSIGAARGDWILVIDGDETLAARDRAAVRELTASPDVLGYRVTIRNYTSSFNVMWNWQANDRRYPKEERASRCPGWTRTWALRLFRNAAGVRYPARPGASAHVTPAASLSPTGCGIVNSHALVLHHFECLKHGGARFIARKQALRLSSEIARTRGRHAEPDAFVNAAKTLFAQRRDRDAAAWLSRAIRRYPSYSDAHFLSGMVALENGRLTLARRRFEAVTSLAPDSPDGWAMLGVVHIECGRHEAAREALERSLSLQSTHLIARNSMGVLAEDLGRRREARSHYRAALRLHPGFGAARANLERVAED